MTFVGLFPRIGWSWPNLSSWKWLNVRGSSLWTIRYHNDKRQLLFLFLHFILLSSGYLPLALTSLPHAYPSWIPFPLHLTQNKTARVLKIFNNFWKSICVFDSWEQRGKVFLLTLFSIYTYVWNTVSVSFSFLRFLEHAICGYKWPIAIIQISVAFLSHLFW